MIETPQSTDAIRAIKPPHQALALGYTPKQAFKGTVERIENAMRILAGIIADDGEEYLPVFQRLETELDIHLAKEKSLKRALYLCQKHDATMNSLKP